jgi:hypothetical protein
MAHSLPRIGEAFSPAPQSGDGAVAPEGGMTGTRGSRGGGSASYMQSLIYVL